MRSELTFYLPMTIHHLHLIRIFVSLPYPPALPPPNPSTGDIEIMVKFHFNKYFWILIIINCVLTRSIKCTCDPYQILMRQLWIGSSLAVLLYISPSIIKKRKENESCFRCIFNIIYFLLQCLYIDIACVFWIPY